MKFENHGPARPKGIIWTGSISLGLVSIPVTLHPAEARKELSFRMLDGRDLSPIGYRKINKNTGEDVPKAEIVKGFELEDERYVVVSEAEFKRASPERTQKIEIVAFVDAGKRSALPKFIPPPALPGPTWSKGRANCASAWPA